MKSKNLMRGLVVSGLGFCLASSALGVLRNFSFESGSGSSASAWNQFGNALREKTGAFSGSYGMKLYGQFSGGTSVSGAYQSVKFQTGRKIQATARVLNRSSDPLTGDNFAVLKLVYFDAAGNEIASNESKAVRGSTAWNQSQIVSASLGPAPSTARSCVAYILFIQPNSTPFAPGSVIFDDVEVQVVPGGQGKLLWQDNFDGSNLDLSKWEPMIGDGSNYGIPGWGNNELQYYTGRNENVVVENGLLKIRARRENFSGRQFTSARLRTLGKLDFRYGRVEARIKVPAGQGLWPAFWMLPSNSPYGTWASSGEIDIMEVVNLADSVHGTIHFGNQWPGQVQNGGSRFLAAGWAADFHTYAVDWEPDQIRWYVDGQLYHTVTSRDWWSAVGSWNQRAPFDTAFHLLLNVAVGGNWPGNPDNGTPFPSEMVVDYVRVYQHPPTGSGGSIFGG